MATARVNGIDLAYEVQGSGPPLLLLPGLAQGRGYYRHGEPYLRSQFTTIGVDPRGVAQSEHGEGPLTAERWADDFAALLDVLNLPRVHLLGSSHGGTMAMALARQHPARVGAMVLVGAFSELDALMDLNFRFRIELVRALGMGDAIADHISLWTMSHQFLDTEAGQATARLNREMVKRNTVERYIELNETILHWGRRLPGQEHEPVPTTWLHELAAPTLALTGDADHFIPASFSRLIADRIPGAVYEELPGCGHIPFLEMPELAAERTAAFLLRHAL